MPMGSPKLGILVWSQYASWPALLDVARAVDAHGYDDLWIWDHLYPPFGDWHGPIFEAWTVLGAWAMATERVRLGPMVAANTFRNPALTAKMATTLDHVSGGRAILGMGAGWSEREHQAYGIDFGSGPGDRLRRLDEASGIIRGMLDGARPSGSEFYSSSEVVNLPRPLQVRLPLWIGGSGERRTLRTVARYADACNISGTSPEDARRKDAVLREHCAELGRDEADIERTVTMGTVFIRDDEREARRLLARAFDLNGGVSKDERAPWMDQLVGTPEMIAEKLRPYIELGFNHIIVATPAPYDLESIERMAHEVRPMIGGAQS